jgi:ElaB/YqjD/DUF883 family membrane-anchored ribosome-binding protein
MDQEIQNGIPLAVPAAPAVASSSASGDGSGDSGGVRRQLGELLTATGDQAHQVVDSLKPLEEQLEHLLDELNSTLRPKIEKPVRDRPLLALGLAAGVGLIVGLLLNSNRRSA